MQNRIILFRFLIFIFAILYSASFIFWNVSADLLYYFNLTESNSVSYMTCFSIMIAKLWLLICGKQIICLKLLGWLLCAFSILIPYCCLQKKTDWTRHLSYLSCGFVLMGSWTQWMYNPDSLTLFLTVLIVVFSVRSELTSGFSLCLLGILLALVTAARLPNAVLVPILCCFVFYRYHIQHLSLFCYLKAIVFTGFIFFVSYETVLYVLTNHDIFYHLTPNTVGTSFGKFEDITHTPAFLISKYAQSFGWGVLNLIEVLLCITCLNFIQIRFNLHKNLWYGILVFFSMFFCFWIVFKSWYVLYSFIVLFIFLLLIRKQDRIENKLSILLIIVCSLVNPLGSDTGFLKSFFLLSAFVPLLLIAFRNKIRSSMLYMGFLFATMFFSSYFFLYYLGHIEKHRYFTDLEYFKGVVVDKDTKDLYEGCYDLFRKYSSEKTIHVYGVPQVHVLKVLTNNAPISFDGYWQYPTDSVQIRAIVDRMDSGSIDCVIDYTSSPIMEYLMKDKSYTLHQENGAYVYLK